MQTFLVKIYNQDYDRTITTIVQSKRELAELCLALSKDYQIEEIIPLQGYYKLNDLLGEVKKVEDLEFGKKEEK